VRSTNFLVVDSAAKLELVWDLPKLWELAASGTLKPPKVTKEEAVVAQVDGAHSSFSFFSSLPLFISHTLLIPRELVHRPSLGQ